MATPNYNYWKNSTSTPTSCTPIKYIDLDTFVNKIFEAKPYNIKPYHLDFINQCLSNFPMEKEYKNSKNIFMRDLAKDIDDMIIREILKETTDANDFKKEYMFDPKNLWSEPICLRTNIVPNVALK